MHRRVFLAVVMVGTVARLTGCRGRLPAGERRRRVRAWLERRRRRIRGGDELAELVERLNAIRAVEEVGPLVPADDLMASAQQWADGMAERGELEHPDQLPEGVWAENIARGPSAAAVVRAWMKSRGHRRNMLGDRWTELGVGERNGFWCLQLR